MRFEKAGIDLAYALQQAGGDAEAEQAAREAHAKAVARLEEQDAKAVLYAAAEESLRAAHQAEIDAVNAHHDELAAAETTRYEGEVETQQARYDEESGALDTELTRRQGLINTFFDDRKAARLLNYENELEEAQIARDAVTADFEERLNIEKLGHDGSLAAWEKYFDDLEAAARAHRATLDPILAAPPPAPGGRVASTSLSGGGGSGGGGFSFGGERAHGGPVEEGKFYTVGEEGSERFYPGQDGTIVPGGGGVTPEAIRRALEGMELRMSDVDRVVMERMPDLAERVL